MVTRSVLNPVKPVPWVVGRYTNIRPRTNRFGLMKT